MTPVPSPDPATAASPIQCGDTSTRATRVTCGSAASRGPTARRSAPEAGAPPPPATGTGIATLGLAAAVLLLAMPVGPRMAAGQSATVAGVRRTPEAAASGGKAGGRPAAVRDSVPAGADEPGGVDRPGGAGGAGGADGATGSRAAREWIGGRPWSTWGTMTGNWAGARPVLGTAGVRVVAGTTAELAGGPRDVAALHLSEVALEVDIPALRVRGVAQLLVKGGRDGLAGADPVHGVSSADADDFAGPGEAWVELTLPGEGARLQAGLMDANAEFAAVEAAGAFVSPALGLSPSLDQLPSYPEPALALTGFARIGRATEAGAAVFTRKGGGARVVGQLRGAAALPGGVPVPAWTVGVVSGPGSLTGTAVEALYLQLEGAPGAAVRPFLTAAASFDGVATASRHVSAGVIHAFGRAVPGTVGVAGSWLRPARDAAGEGRLPDEGLLEAFVRLEPVPWLAVQPDLQLSAPLDGSAPVHAVALLRVVLRY